ncbi:MAG: amidohydrolase family protein [Ferruginibacter sp.]
MYRKFTADHIFTGNVLLAANKVLIINDGDIITGIVDSEDAGDDIQVLKGLLCPGFINAHCHLELSHLKGIIPEKTGLVEFVQTVMRQREPPLHEVAGTNDLRTHMELKQVAMQAAVEELYKTGTAAVGDICNTSDSIFVKNNSKLHWHNFIEVSGFTDAGAANRLESIKKVYQEFDEKTWPATLSPHAPYSVSKTLFKRLNDLTADQLITIHNQESSAENELYQNKTGGFLELYRNFGIDISSFVPTGKSSSQSWLPYFNRQQSIISVHNSFINKDDIEFADKQVSKRLHNIYYCICINANKYIEDTIPPLNLLREKSDNIVLGTDSYASNRQLNLFEEIKTIQAETGSDISLPEVLRWATINGAKALRMEEKLGSFNTNKQPGIVLIEQLENLSTTPASFARRIV